ncbi:MAG: hypothetical protein ABIQ99_10780 [Thermoflexales bacterium]
MSQAKGADSDAGVKVLVCALATRTNFGIEVTRLDMSLLDDMLARKARAKLMLGKKL